MCNGVKLFSHMFIICVMYCFMVFGASLSRRTKVGLRPACFSLLWIVVKAWSKCVWDLDGIGWEIIALLS